MIKLMNTGSNQQTVTINDLDIFFSYETPIGFRHNYEVVVSENIWSRTTAKHLTALPCAKEDRIPNKDFMEQLNKVWEGGNA